MTTIPALRQRNEELSTTQELGVPLPLRDLHAVSVSLPTWASVVGYEEGDVAITEKMSAGYPRFRFQNAVAGLMDLTLALYYQQRIGKSCMVHFTDNSVHSIQKIKTEFSLLLLPSIAVARRFHTFMKIHLSIDEVVEVFFLHSESTVVAAVYPACHSSTAKRYWQHTGEIVSSREAVKTLQMLLSSLSSSRFITSPTIDNLTEIKLFDFFTKQLPSGNYSMPISLVSRESGSTITLIDDVFGLNPPNPVPPLLDSSYHIITQRIQSIVANTLALTENEESSEVDTIQEEDIQLCISGMAAIFTAFRLIQHAYTTETGIKNGHIVVFGFPYLDTLKIMQRTEWNQGGVTFFGHGDEEEFRQLEILLENSVLAAEHSSSHGGFGSRIMAIFMEFPSNPLMKCVDISRLAALAHRYGVLLVADDTIANFANVNLFTVPLWLPHEERKGEETDCAQKHVRGVDILCSSLTKIFSGTGNVMCGSVILNSNFKDARYYSLRSSLDCMRRQNDIPYPFSADLDVLELNSRDFLYRSHHVNQTALQLAEYLYSKQTSGIVTEIHYPGLSSSPSLAAYNSVLRPPTISTDTAVAHQSGYGCLISFVISDAYSTEIFYDSLQLNKGPSLGANFTLVCPYTLLAHYMELDWAQSYHVHPKLIRVSVGLEDFIDLREKFELAFTNMLSCK